MLQYMYVLFTESLCFLISVRTDFWPLSIVDKVNQLSGDYVEK